jgi:predicted nucleotidyltransferase component of viral defense system
MIYREIITDKMASVAKIIFTNFSPSYYLAGGTAIALQIGHRESIDLDYFINEDIDTQRLKDLINENFKNSKVDFVFEERNTLWCIIDGVKVSFISRFDILINKIVIIEDFRFASIEDLIVMKLSAICSREEYKDYFDLATLATVSDAHLWMNWWLKVYKNSDPISFLIALASVDNSSEIPLNIKDKFKDISPKELLPKVVSQIKKYFLA